MFDLDNDAHRRQLVIFSKFYHSYHELHKNYKLLALSGFLTPKLLHYEILLRIYFLRISEYKMLWPIGYMLDLRALMPSFFSLERAIKKAKVDKLADHIENFFCKWFNPSNKTNYDFRPSQYELFLSDLFQSKIKLTDEQITEFYGSHVEGILNLGPYEINLIFLYAISTPVENWSIAFGGRFSEVDTRLVEGLFPRVLDFIKSNFNNDEKETSFNLKNESYPDELIQQLDWLENEYRKYLWITDGPLGLDPLDINEFYERPKNSLLLPSQLRSAEDWIGLVDILPRSPNGEVNKLWNDIYMCYTVKIHLILERAIKANKEISFESCLFSLPKNTYRASFIQEVIEKKALIHAHHCRDAVFYTVATRELFLTDLLINYCMKYLEKGWEFVLIKNYQTDPNEGKTLALQHFVNLLNSDTKIQLFNHLGTDLAKFLLNRRYLIKYLKESSDEQALTIVDCIIENKLFIALSKHYSDDGWDKFSSILQAISHPIPHIKMRLFMTDNLADLIERLLNLNDFLQLPGIDTDRIDFEKIIDKFKNNFPFSKMLSFFSNNLKFLIIKSLGANFYNHLHNLEDLLNIFSLFNHPYKRVDILAHFDLNNCSSYLVKGVDVYKCIKILSAKDKAILIAHLGTALRNIVQDKTDFLNILGYLALDAIPFIKYFEHNLTEFIDKEEILIDVIEAVSEESPSDQLISLAALKEPIKKLITNENQLNGLLRKIPSRHHTLCLDFLSASLDLSSLDCDAALKDLSKSNQAAIMQYLADICSSERSFSY